MAWQDVKSKFPLVDGYVEVSMDYKSRSRLPEMAPEPRRIGGIQSHAALIEFQSSLQDFFDDEAPGW